MSIYVSQGTIRIVAADSVAPAPHAANFAAHLSTAQPPVSPNALLQFVPSPEYSIKHWNRNFAVFVSSASVVRPDREARLLTREDVMAPPSRYAIVREYDQRKIIEIDTKVHMADLPDIISGAALDQTNVQIRVKVKRNRVPMLHLVGVEIPAT